MQRSSILLSVLALVFSVVCYSRDRSDHVFAETNSVLLFGLPYHELRVVTDARSQLVHPPNGFPEGRGEFLVPDLSPDADTVAWSFALPNGDRSGKYHFVMGVYSVSSNSWKTYGDFSEHGGSAAFSPDGKRVAFTTELHAEDGSDLGAHSQLWILDIATGTLAEVKIGQTVYGGAKLSWSPDGKLLALQIYTGGETPAIGVIDPVTGAVKTIGNGFDPSWSPSGEWIAFSSGTRQKCMLIHSDGSGVKTALDIGRRVLGYREFVYGAVWSPDNSKLLLNEMKGDGPNINVVLLDLKTGKVITKSQDGLPVFGWRYRNPEAGEPGGTGGWPTLFPL